jgi:hypothetical protein
MKATLKKHLVNAIGKRLDQKYIVFESDDWGAIRIPDTHTRDELLKNGLLKQNDPFSRFDTIETSEDYNSIFDVLKKHKDQSGNHPIITANIILNNPDFDAIEKINYEHYTPETFQETYKKNKGSDDAFKILQQGINQNLFNPQFHGSEHLNVVRWMKYLKSGDERYQYAFNRKCFAIDEIGNQNRRHNLMATYDYDNEEELAFVKKNIKLGLNQFENIFGFKSLTSIAPCYVWDIQIEQEMLDCDVLAFQGSFLQNYPIPGKPFKKIYHFIGQKNNHKQFYFVRNGLFEPSLNPKIDWVSKCMESIEIAFKWKKPAIIGTHRINFVGGLDELQRNQNLQKLDLLFAKIIQKWPDVKFISSSELIQKYSKTT